VLTSGCDLSWLPAGGVVAVSFASDIGRSGLVCALFHSVDDGAEFGTTLAAHVLASFLESYPDVDVRSVLDSAMYTGFGARVLDVVRSATRPILDSRT